MQRFGLRKLAGILALLAVAIVVNISQATGARLPDIGTPSDPAAVSTNANQAGVVQQETQTQAHSPAVASNAMEQIKSATQPSNNRSGPVAETNPPSQAPAHVPDNGLLTKSSLQRKAYFALSSGANPNRGWDDLPSDTNNNDLNKTSVLLNLTGQRGGATVQNPTNSGSISSSGTESNGVSSSAASKSDDQHQETTQSGDHTSTMAPTNGPTPMADAAVTPTPAASTSAGNKDGVPLHSQTNVMETVPGITGSSSTAATPAGIATSAGAADGSDSSTGGSSSTTNMAAVTPNPRVKRHTCARCCDRKVKPCCCFETLFPQTRCGRAEGVRGRVQDGKTTPSMAEVCEDIRTEEATEPLSSHVRPGSPRMMDETPRLEMQPSDDDENESRPTHHDRQGGVDTLNVRLRAGLRKIAPSLMAINDALHSRREEQEEHLTTSEDLTQNDHQASGSVNEDGSEVYGIFNGKGMGAIAEKGPQQQPAPLVKGNTESTAKGASADSELVATQAKHNSQAAQVEQATETEIIQPL